MLLLHKKSGHSEFNTLPAEFHILLRLDQLEFANRIPRKPQCQLLCGLGQFKVTKNLRYDEFKFHSVRPSADFNANYTNYADSRELRFSMEKKEIHNNPSIKRPSYNSRESVEFE